MMYTSGIVKGGEHEQYLGKFAPYLDEPEKYSILKPLRGGESMLTVFAEIQQEYERQKLLKAQGKFKYTCEDVEMLQTDRCCVLIEEVGEVAREILNYNGYANDVGKGDNLKKELIQVAAVCVAWLEGLKKPNIY